MSFQSAACTALQKSGDLAGSFYKNYKWATSSQERIIRSMYLEIFEIKLIIEEHTKYLIL